MQLPGFSASLDLEQLPWRPTRFRGVRWFPLREEVSQELREEAGEGPPAEPEAEASDDATVLIQMDPGCSYPAHRHRGIEEVLVLMGGYRDELGLHPAGSYVRYSAGSVHAPVAEGRPDEPVGPENPACLLFASARGGVENLDPGS